MHLTWTFVGIIRLGNTPPTPDLRRRRFFGTNLSDSLPEMPHLLPSAFFQRDARVVARELLGHVLVTSMDNVRTAGVIVETEAYLGEGDQASHSYRGMTTRNAPMFLNGGHVYVYRSYGIHHCMNISTSSAGVGEAVLIRGVEPIEGIDVMRTRCGKPTGNPKRLADGPGKLTVAFGVSLQHNGLLISQNSEIRVERGNGFDDDEVVATPRIGITKATELLWRWVRRSS